MKVVTFFHLKEVRWNLPDSELERLQARFPGVRVVAVEDPVDLAVVLPDAEIFAGFHFPRQHFAAFGERSLRRTSARCKRRCLRVTKRRSRHLIEFY